MRKPDGQTVFLGLLGLGTVATVVYLVFFSGNGHAGNQKTTKATLRSSPVEARRSFEYLKSICAIGPRISGTKGMAKQQELLTDHFGKAGGRVSLQEWDVRHPQDGSKVRLANMVVEFHPDRKERVVLCCHYDTRPYPDRDPRRPRGRFIGANDGGSGVAVLMELANHVGKLDGRYGVDFVLFDAEEFIFDEQRDPFFLGSEHFAQQYVQQPPAHKYRWGVLLDMVGDAQLQLFQEKNSVSWPDTRPLVDAIWGTARQMGVVEFVNRTKHEVRDDHLALRNIARIPTCDIIDFDYPRSGGVSYWHTEQDTVDKCSADSLGKVGAVLLEWLRTAE